MSPAQGFRWPFASQVGWYLAVGACGFVADAFAYWIFAHAFGWPTATARLAAFVPATLATWAINRRFTFARHSDDAPESAGGAGHGPLWQYLRYLAVQGGGIVVSFITFQSLLVQHPSHDLLSLAAGSIVALAFNFAGSRLLVFTGKAGDASPLVIAAFGLLSVALGQDANWDLANYHLYNAYALLEGRLGVDFAAAGVQSYFNPLLDLGYFVLTMHLPAPAVAFVMGAVHGLAALLLAAIVRQVLPDASPKQAWLLAIAGCLGATFLGGLGNSMGDDTTALLVIAALLLCLRSLPAMATREASLCIAAAGLLVGAATGLKLTNAPAALGLAAGFLICAAPVRDRLRALASLTAGGIAGLLLTTGWWWARMWSEFGNPLFPQFNSFFASQLASPMGAIDPRWGPKNAFEVLAYPFVFTISPSRLGETPILQLLWPVAYALFIAWGVVALRSRRAARGVAPMESGARFVMAFAAVAYLAWLVVFGIGRYAVAIELLLPLVVWVLLPTVWPHPAATRVARWAIIVSVVVGLVGFKSWGHVSFAERSYTVPALPIVEPSRTTIVFVAQPVAWMVPFLPADLAFVSLANFPESAGTLERIQGIAAKRGGDMWAVIPAAADTAANTVGRFNAWAQDKSLSADGWLCAAAGRIAKSSSRYRSYAPAPGRFCRFEQSAPQRRDLEAENRAIAARWTGLLRGRGFQLDAPSCGRHEGYIGDQPQPFQFCRLAR